MRAKGINVEKLLLTPEDAADVLSISRSKLYDLLAVGKLDSIRIGASRRISRTALEDFVARCSAEVEAA